MTKTRGQLWRRNLKFKFNFSNKSSHEKSEDNESLLETLVDIQGYSENRQEFPKNVINMPSTTTNSNNLNLHHHQISHFETHQNFAKQAKNGENVRDVDHNSKKIDQKKITRFDVPSSMIKLSDEEQLQLEYVLFEMALREVGLA